MRDRGSVSRAKLVPLGAEPFEPAVLFLIEHVQRFVAELRELRTPARTASYRFIGEDAPNHVDFLAGIHLIPQRLQNFADRDALGVPPVHESRDILQADVAGL